MEPPERSVQLILRPGIERPSADLEGIVLRTMEIHGLTGEVVVLLCDDAEIAQLNGDFRSLPSPTDVLTFDWQGEDGLCGELAISVPTARLQADRRGMELEDELAYLCIHGTLHLAGFDDEDDDSRKHMQSEMSRLGVQFGLPHEDDWHSLYDLALSAPASR